MPHAHRFCLLTTGRSGSTSLMDALAACDDIVVPNTFVPCIDNELVHPDFLATYMRQFGEIAGRDIDNADALIETFFELSADAGYAGFKSMPYRHDDFDALVARDDIRLIILLRRDVIATVASFAAARSTGSWRRRGGTPEAWTFGDDDRTMVSELVEYVCTSNEQLAAVPRAIRLFYEELCDSAFTSRELDEFFNRAVRLHAPCRPARIEDYVTNHAEFGAFVDAALA